MTLRRSRMLRAMALLAVLVAPCARAFDAEYYEEDAGMDASLLLNPVDGVYGIGYEAGTWLRDTPIFGNLVVSTFYTDIEESFYGGIGMIFRIMPHWKFAPFIGAGTTYNYPVWNNSSDSSDTSSADPLAPGAAEEEEAEAFWGGHAEAGFRYWYNDRHSFVDLSARQTWSSTGSGHEYWIGSIAFGQTFDMSSDF